MAWLDSDAIHRLLAYLELADAAGRRNRPLVRDRLLVVAATMAYDMRRPTLAEVCRQRIVESQPGHLLARAIDFVSLAEDDDLRSLVNAIVRRYPLERVERMGKTLGIARQTAQAKAGGLVPYVASLLATTVDSLGPEFRL